MTQPKRCILVTIFCLSARLLVAEETVDFNRDIRSIFAEKCLQCHGADKSEGNLRLDVGRHAFSQLESGQFAIVPHQPNQSELLKRVATDDSDLRMPPEGEALSNDQIELLNRWIKQGAPWNEHWAYQPLSDAQLPSVQTPEWCNNEIDYFVLSKLESKQIAPSTRAKRTTLVRRLYLDLLGLPPTFEQVESFLNDQAPDAYERLVDQLLASPRFGERWGRHWLDKARYADSDGYEKDRNRPNAWRYRDWVIRAINDDLPFDQFSTEQLAGDLIPNAKPDQILATAFHRQTLTNTEGGTDQEQWRVAAVMDRTETLGTVWLGLSVGCARCHNHKYDSISQREYYQLFAFFNNGDETTTKLPNAAWQQKQFKRNNLEFEERIKTLQSELNQLKQTLGDDHQKVKKLSAELDAQRKIEPKSPENQVRIIRERTSNRRSTHILRRGEFKQPLEQVSASTLSSLPTNQNATTEKTADTAELNRIDLTNWLFNQANPIAARVAANHLWQKLFGFGIVRTTNDFGVRGSPATHPQLLDHLARRYQQTGWSRKQLIRHIVLSATYQQASKHRPELKDVDPNNRWLYRQNRFRVEAEIIRDIALSVSQLLTDRIGGPSVFPPMPPEAAAVSYANSFKWKNSSGSDRYRRGLYTFFKRTAPHPTLTTFDCPDANTTNVQRNRSNTPIGALVLLNNEVYQEAAMHFAIALVASPSGKDERIELAFKRCFGRSPSLDEIKPLRTILENAESHFVSHPADAEKLTAKVPSSTVVFPAREFDFHSKENTPTIDVATWTVFARVLLNLDEFVTRE